MNENVYVHAEANAAIKAYREAVKSEVRARRALESARLEAATAKTALTEAILAGKISTRQFLRDSRNRICAGR